MQNDVLLQDLEDAEDALSLCDLPLHYKDDELVNWEDAASTGDTLTSSEHDHFEFANDQKVETRPSENIIFCGKLFPSKQPLSHHTHIPKTFEFHPRLRSEQLNLYKLQSSSFNSDRGRIISNNRCLGHDKFQRTSSSRASPMPSASSYSYQPPMKPRWYMGLFGLTRFPRKMEMEDLRIRQDRLSRPPLNGGETVSVKSGGGKGSWGLLRAISCQASSKAASTASISCMPNVVRCGSIAARAIPK